ncbi:sensor histidine kinase [Pseudarthrobacter sp. H2]|uniref:sensor histidine kinase n=1 Tax=Pseudarthrobacter sp. H2 TaxID=3418415 RepID=UPI003CF81EBA
MRSVRAWVLTAQLALISSAMLVSGAAARAVQPRLPDGRVNGDLLPSLGMYGITSLLTLLAAGAVGVVVAGRLRRPIRRLRDATEHLSLGNPGQRVALPSPADDDVAVLAARFNAMLDRLERGVVERRQFLGDAGHQLGAPLAAIRRHVEQLSTHAPGDVTGTCNRLLEEVDAMQRLVSDFQVLAGSGLPGLIRAEWIDIDQFLEDAVQRALILGGRRWILGLKPGGWLLADRQCLSRAVDQLAAHAVGTTSEDDTISVGGLWTDSPALTVRSSAAATKAGSALIGGLDLWVSDTGPGIPAEEHQRIFERCARSGPASAAHGAGLGLPIVKAIAEAHGGSVRVQSAARGGSRFTLWIPARPDNVRQHSPAGRALLVPGHR